MEGGCSQELTQERATEFLQRCGFQSNFRRKEGAATLHPFKVWGARRGGGERDPEPSGADAREARD